MSQDDTIAGHLKLITAIVYVRQECRPRAAEHNYYLMNHVLLNIVPEAQTGSGFLADATSPISSESKFSVHPLSMAEMIKIKQNKCAINDLCEEVTLAKDCYIKPQASFPIY